ncbi:Fpg/Nei family DNA glycosylase [Pedobacter steynii]
MPELPDLEVFAANLEKRFKHKTLERLKAWVIKKLNVSEKELRDQLQGRKLFAVKREGKTLQLHFEGGNVLGLHLMLHGELKTFKHEEELKHPIISLCFKDADGFALTDFQKAATPTFNPPSSDVPDALSDEMSLSYLERILAKTKKPVKTLLMDQHVIRGIGNTYADEILWAARISPMSLSKAIPKAKVKDLYHLIGTLLRKEIAQIGGAMSDQLSGEIKDFLKIHGAHIKESPTGKKVQVTKIGGRKSYFTDEQELFQ